MGHLPRDSEMRKLTSILGTIALGLMLLFPTVLRADKRITSARASYEKQLAAIERKHDGGSSSWHAKYEAELKALKGAVQAAGDLEGLGSLQTQRADQAHEHEVRDARHFFHKL